MTLDAPCNVVIIDEILFWQTADFLNDAPSCNQRTSGHVIALHQMWQFIRVCFLFVIQFKGQIVIIDARRKLLNHGWRIHAQNFRAHNAYVLILPHIIEQNFNAVIFQNHVIV